MRVVDLDRDMTDVIPVGITSDSLYVFERMENVTLDALRAKPGARVLDAAGGLGQDSYTLAGRGVFAVCAEPSRRMSDLGRMLEAKKDGDATVHWTRTWSESLPFRSGCFDATFCKGALDHFDDPAGCIGEMARVTRADGRVVLAVANFQSLGTRLQRLLDRVRGRAGYTGRRPYHVPSDHFTRYDALVLREQLERHVIIEQWTGISLLWKVKTWGALLERVPPGAAQRLLRWADAVARRFPSLADVIIVGGRPR